MADVGYGGAYVPLIVGESTLNECRNLAGPSPTPGKKWIMMNLDTGELKWYTGARRRTFGGAGFNRRFSNRRR